MSLSAPNLALILLALSSAAYFFGRKRAYSVANQNIRKLHSLPSYYGLYSALWCIVPAFLVLALWVAFESSWIDRLVMADLPTQVQNLDQSHQSLVLNDIKNLVAGNITSGTNEIFTLDAVAHYKSLQTISHAVMLVVVLSFAAAGVWIALKRIHPDMRARNAVEKVLTLALALCASIAILTTLGIVLSVFFESLRFFQAVPITEFIFGTEWSPQIAMREDQAGSSGAFGSIPLFAGTLLISLIAMTVAAPVGLMSAIYLSEYASLRVRNIVKPLLELLAGIPTVVYGFFAALVVAPKIREFGSVLGLDVASESALAAGLVMGIMIIPFVSSLSDDVINAVPQSLRDGAYGLGATRSETIRRVIFPTALPGIVSGLLLAISRAIGETMIVVMAAGLASNLTANPLEAVTTVTVQIVTLLTGDQEFDSPKTLAAFALGLVLFVITLILNVIALHIVRKYREQYD